MVLSSFECWATCEADSEVREFSRPRNRSVDFFKPPEQNFVSQSCYHGFSRVVDNNNVNNVQETEDCQPMEVVPISSATAVPSRKRFFTTEASSEVQQHDKCKKPKFEVPVSAVPAYGQNFHRVSATMSSHMM
ncbi:hypothetical protein ACFFRR_010331 [Megaselia abdita]